MTVIIKSSEDKEKIKTILEKLDRKGKLNAYKHLDKIKLKKTPEEIQKAMRSEW